LHFEVQQLLIKKKPLRYCNILCQHYKQHKVSTVISLLRTRLPQPTMSSCARKTTSCYRT